MRRQTCPSSAFVGETNIHMDLLSCTYLKAEGSTAQGMHLGSLSKMRHPVCLVVNTAGLDIDREVRGLSWPVRSF